uniref:Uncharacterized protein n=1 Tax=Oryza meridionalis TaxID=40149 RepID=A0A0E0BWX4_9ORYZ
MRASSPPHSALDLFRATCSLPLISTSSRSLRAREVGAAVGPVPAVFRACAEAAAGLGISKWAVRVGPNQGTARWQAVLDATDAAAASLLRDHRALDDGNTRLGIVLIQAHAEKSKVKCQESQPLKAFNGYKQPLISRELTMDFQWVQGTIDSKGTDCGLVKRE